MNGGLGIGGLARKASAVDKMGKNLSEAGERVKAMTEMLTYLVKVCGKEGAEKLLDELGLLMIEYAKEAEGKSPKEMKGMGRTYEKKAAVIIDKYVPGPNVKEFSRLFGSGARVWAPAGAIAGGVVGLAKGATIVAGADAIGYATFGMAIGAGAGLAMGAGLVALTFGSPYLVRKGREKFRERRIRKLAWRPGEVIPKKK